MMQMSRRDRRAAAVGVVVTAVTLLLGRGLPLWKRWVDEERDRAWQTQATAARMRALAASRSRLALMVAAASKDYLALAPHLLGADTPPTAGATLLAMVSNAAVGAGLQIGSIQSTGDSAGVHFARVAVRGEASGDVEGLTTFLEALETGPVITGVRELSVDQPEPGAPNDQSEALRIQFVVEGIALRRGSSR